MLVYVMYVMPIVQRMTRLTLSRLKRKNAYMVICLICDCYMFVIKIKTERATCDVCYKKKACFMT